MRARVCVSLWTSDYEWMVLCTGVSSDASLLIDGVAVCRRVQHQAPLDDSSIAWYGSWLPDSLDGHSMQYGSEPVEVGCPQPVSTACSLST